MAYTKNNRRGLGTINKKFIIIAAIALFAAIGAFRNPYFSGIGQGDSSASAGKREPAVFFVPHQDDETLSMGASIIEHIAAGRNVKIVLVGDGTATIVTERLCDESKKQGKKALAKFCGPNGPQLTGEARDREFAAAVRKLGVAASNVEYERRPEAKVTIHAAQEIIGKYVSRYGKNASYIAMSWLDADSDHYNFGYALNSRCVTTGPASRREPPELNDCRFYQSAIYDTSTPSQWFKTRDRAPTPPDGYYTANTTDKQKRLREAIAEYKLNDWDKGRYGIGYRSVGDQFDYLSTKMRSHWHKPSDSWSSTSAMAESVRFTARHQFSRGEY